MFFDCGGTDVNVPTEEPKCLICLCCNTVYMAIPFKIRLYSDTKIVGFICMFKLVSMYEYFNGVLFRVMDSTLHLSGWKPIFHFCSHMLSLSRSF